MKNMFIKMQIKDVNMCSSRKTWENEYSNNYIFINSPESNIMI